MTTTAMPDVLQCRRCGAELPTGHTGPSCERCQVSEYLLLSHFAGATTAPAAQARGEVRTEDGEDFGDYTLLNEIARGGMGYVHRARQKSLNRIVALKRPLAGLAADPERVRRFRIEAESIAALSHPNIIPVFESGEFRGEQFFSMAYVEGAPLSEVIRRRRISPEAAARYVRKIAGAIHHAHQRGVLHRDLKPANILIDESDEPRVADFGLACLLQTESSEHAVAGTAHYMAPEQMRPGHAPLSVATDVYALGGILYHLLTGHPPFEGATRDEIFWAAYYEEPTSPSVEAPGVSRDLEAICLKALEKRPENRYASAQDLADDLLRYEQRRPVRARPVPVPIRVGMWMRRNPFTSLLLLALFSALATGAVAQWNATQNIRTARASSEGFIGFMNQDLAADLRDIGRIDLLEKINSRAEAYYTNYLALGDAGYGERKARFFENAATVTRDLGDLDGAETRAAEAEAIYEAQAKAAPHEARWARLRSRVHLLRATFAREGQLHDLAEQHARQAVDFATASVNLEPANPENRAQLAIALLDQANAWFENGQLEGPTANVTTADRLFREITVGPDANPNWLFKLACCAYTRGVIAQKRRDRPQAFAEFTQYLHGIQTLVDRFPRNNRWTFELAIANSRVADVLSQLKQYDVAQPYYDTFERLSASLVQLDPRNTTWRGLYAQSIALQADVARRDDPRGSAPISLFTTAFLMQSNLVHQNPDWEQWCDDEKQTITALIALHVAQGRRDQALELSQSWVDECKGRALAQPEHVGHQLRWGDAIVRNTSLRFSSKNLDDRMRTAEQALTNFVHVRPESMANLAKARVLAYLADGYFNYDRRKAAETVQEALNLRLRAFPRVTHGPQLRKSIPDTYRWTVTYLLMSEQTDRALDMAKAALNWAVQVHLRPEEGRKDYGAIADAIATAAEAEPFPRRAEARQLIERCLTERFQTPPDLSPDDQQRSDRLRQWLAQHP